MKRRPRGYWQSEHGKAVIRRCVGLCETQREMVKRFYRAYYAAHLSGDWDELKQSLKTSQRPNGTWTKEHVIKTLKGSATCAEARRECSAALSAAYKLGCYKEATAHFVDPTKGVPDGYWTPENAMGHAKEFDRIIDFKRAYPQATTRFAKPAWWMSRSRHVVIANKGLGRTSPQSEPLSESTVLRQKPSLWRNFGAPVAASGTGGWPSLTWSCPVAGNYWTDERLIEFASRFATVKDMKAESASAYTLIHRRGLQEQALGHMTNAATGLQAHAPCTLYYWRVEGPEAEPLYKMGSPTTRILPGELRRRARARHGTAGVAVRDQHGG